MPSYHQPLLPNHTYHLFSRAIGREKLFHKAENYVYFLQKLKQNTSSVCQFYTYALLPNHFHLLSRINNEEKIISHFEEVKKIKFEHEQHNLSEFIMERFSNFLNAYAKAFNKSINRKGALFMDYMKRSIVNESSDFTAYIWYIHKNAVHHEITKTVGEWQFDSYRSMLSEAPTMLLRDEVIEWFGSRNEFFKFHRQEIIPKREFYDL